MRITVHRGTDQIGGCITEYESKGWKLFVDFGEQLPGAPVSDCQPDIEGLTRGDVGKSALLITHYHGDHIGRIAELPAELPVFMGSMAKDIASVLFERLSYVSDKHRRLAERVDSAQTFMPGKPMAFGCFTVTPMVIDHSAFDAYAFRIEADGATAFHTGDFRTHGFRSAKLPEVIERYAGTGVDCLVCEATNVNRPAGALTTESELQKEYENAFRESKYNVVYASSTNIDRVFSLYHAAMKAGRPFYVDAYQKKIMDTVAGRDSVWGKSELFSYASGPEPKVLKREGHNFGINQKFKKRLADKGYVLLARSGERFDTLISQMPGEGRRTFLSMWDGYIDNTNPAYNPALAKSLGADYEFLHTSGHCDMRGLGQLMELMRPAMVIPIHTDDPGAFAGMFGDRWEVKLPADGESFDINNS